MCRVACILVWAALLGAAGAAAREPARPVWIDTDAACGAGLLADVDDCIALLMAARSPRLALRGVGAVFGNAPQARTHEIARGVLGDRADIPVHPGAARAGDGDTPASRALIAALRRERLTVLALGPLTNVAAALRRHPELAARIDALIVVAGRDRAGWMRAGANPLAHFHDVNVRHDPAAMAAVLESGVRLVFVPFDRQGAAALGEADLARWRQDGAMPVALLDQAGVWLSVWRYWHGASAFLPFDAVAVAYAIAPDSFACRDTGARLATGRGLADRRRLSLWLGEGGVAAAVCKPASPSIKRLIEGALAGQMGEEP